MKNKKLLNIYLLLIALISLITFILPISKVDINTAHTLFTRIVYYTCNVLIIISLSLVILVAILNLFTDKYDGVYIMESFAFLAFFLAMINLIIFASNLFYAFEWGYIIFIAELFLLNAFNQIVRLVTSFKNFKSFFKSLKTIKIESKTDAEE